MAQTKNKGGRPRGGPDGQRVRDLPRVELRMCDEALDALDRLRGDRPRWAFVRETILAMDKRRGGRKRTARRAAR